jgi:hypothetical protein
LAALCFSVLQLGTPAAAQVGALATETFQESLRANVPAGGEIFRGLHKSPLDARPRFDQVSVALPAGNQGRLCVKVETQDGRYLGEASYLIGRRPSPITRALLLPTMHRGLLEALPIRDISIVAYVAEACAARERLYVPMFPGVARLPAGEIVVLVNSRTPDVIVRVFHEEARRYQACERDTASERQVAFNVECRIDLPAGTHHATLTVARHRGEKVLDPVTVNVYVP